MSDEPVGQTVLKEGVQPFLEGFYKAFVKRDLNEVQQCYEQEWGALTEKHFKTSPWPAPEVVGPVVGGDQLFLTLYKEMYFRHIYAIGGASVTLQDRIDSFNNYHALFKNIMAITDDTAWDLPNQWIWDIMDEFVYQYNDFCKFRTKVATRARSAEAEDAGEVQALETLRAAPQYWNTGYVICMLSQIPDKSDIKRILQDDLAGKPTVSTAEITEGGPKHLTRMVGYYSLVQLLRLHSLLGDYHAALQAVDCLDFHRTDKIFSKVYSCQITLYYYGGFVLMMQRRYTDAFHFFISLVQFISRVKNIHTKEFQYNDLQKKLDQGYHLLAIVATLSGRRLDEGLQQTLREKLQEKATRLAQGDLDVIADSFKHAAPKFVSAVTDYDDADLGYLDAMEQQRTLFLDEVRQVLALEAIRCYLSLYSTISIEKLASFMEQETEGPGVRPSQFRTYLLQLKQRTRERVWRAGSRLSDAERQSISDVDFYIDKDMVHITTNRTQQQCTTQAQYFVDQIRSLDALQVEVDKL